jgi:hypothetical protein
MLLIGRRYSRASAIAFCRIYVVASKEVLSSERIHAQLETNETQMKSAEKLTNNSKFTIAYIPTEIVVARPAKI